MKFTVFPLMLLLCLVFSVTAKAQTATYSVKGSVTDSSTHVHLQNATIIVLNAKDSIMRQFTRANENGSFTINKLSPGKFMLMVSYPDYADYVEQFELTAAKPEHNFGKVNLRLKSKLLQEVLIKGTVAAIKIKGDTTEFDPRAYTIQPNSKVEDLLKQLPGIQVDKDGKITAQGQTVNKVLVDGEEFFGDDPTLVTKNIRGDMVDKVQLYDKKSDQATLTGIDDGIKNKTINIKLKEDKKNGYFGKLDGGYGTDEYYSAQAMYNRFKGKKKFSAYGIAANTGKTGLGWEDNNKYGSGGLQSDNDGNLSFNSGRDDLESYDGRYNGQGIPKARTGGVHYDNKWDKDNKSINTNYKIGYLEIDGNQNAQNQNSVQGGLIKSNSDQNFTKSVFRQKADVTYQVKLDTTSNLKISVDGTAKTSKNDQDYFSTSTDGNDILLNRNQRSLNNKVDDQFANFTALYTKKFKKKGRSFSLNVAANMNNSDSKGFLNSLTNYYNATTGLVDSTQSTNQMKTATIRSHNAGFDAAYTEPITKKITMAVSYGLSDAHNNADRRSYNQSGTPGVYDVLDTLYSNKYTFDQLSNNFKTSLNFQGAKTTINIGTRANAVGYKQVNDITGNVFNRSFLNWYPNARYQYRFSQQQSFSVNYSGNTSQPTIDQIQPVRNNNDNLNIVLGNPDLRPAFGNNFNINYNSYKVLTEQYIYLSGNYAFTSNTIVNNTITDKKTGKSTSQAVNLGDHQTMNYNFYSGMGQKFSKLDNFNVGLDLSTNGNKSYNYINNELNATTSSNYNVGLNLSKYKLKKYEFRIGGGPGYSFGKTSLQPDVNNNGYTFNGYGYFSLYLPLKIQINADGNYQHRGKTQSFDDTFDRTLINASISKKFLKQENLKAVISCNDILNQNQGFSRNAYGGSISQTSYTTVKRYLMFSIVWDFNKMGGGVPQQPKN